MDFSVITTFRCDSKCQMCYIWQNPSKSAEEIGPDVLAKLPGGFDNLNITGGEPTLRHDLPAIVEVLQPKGRILEISTNGLHADRLEPIIRKYPCTKVRFSLEGMDLLNDRIRGEEGGFEKKLAGMKVLQAAGGKDLGFATVIQDENADQLAGLYAMAQEMGLELSTSTLHNAWQFHKNDNYFYDRVRVAHEVEKLIEAMLRTNSVKNWFRAYMNLGLIKKILGQDRLMPCTAGTDFAFVDPWGKVWACNVRTDLPMGDLKTQTWEQIINSDVARQSIGKVKACSQNCWMVTTARTAMRSKILPQLPKLGPLEWVIRNKIRTALGMHVCFDKYIDYANVKETPRVERHSFLGKKDTPRKTQAASDPHYTLGEFENQ